MCLWQCFKVAVIILYIFFIYLIIDIRNPPITSLDFFPSIAPFVGVSSYALEIEHVFLPGGRRRGEHDIVLRVLSACLWGMEAGQLLGSEDWVLSARAIYCCCSSGWKAPKRAWKGQAAACVCCRIICSAQLLGNLTPPAPPLI